MLGEHSTRTSAVLGTLSQKTSTLMSPREVWSVTDIVGTVNIKADQLMIQELVRDGYG